MSAEIEHSDPNRALHYFKVLIKLAFDVLADSMRIVWAETLTVRFDRTTLLLLIAVQAAHLLKAGPVVAEGLVAASMLRMYFAYHPQQLAHAVAHSESLRRL